MPGSSEIFLGQRLQIAREFRGLTQKQIAEQVAASPALISLCEAGKKKDPAPDLVEAFGVVLGFEPGFFYQPIAEFFLEQECSFRHRRTTPERLKNKIRAHGNLIGMVVERVKAFLSFPRLNIPKIPAVTNEEIEAAAESCRHHWDLGLDAPILHIGRVLEHAGVVIVPHVVQSTKVDAFSRSGRISIIFLNQAVQSTSRWIFDIAHECGHLVMHPGIQTGAQDTERAADRFASAFLMPRMAFAREFGMKPFSWNYIFDLKRRWRVSAQAIVRRSYDLGLIDAVTYRQAFKAMSAKGWRSKGEPHEPAFQEPEMFSAALNALGNKVELTLETLCGDLHFKPATFFDVTGIPVPKPKSAPVLAFCKS